VTGSSLPWPTEADRTTGDEMPRPHASEASPCYLVTVLYNCGDCIPAFLASLAAQDFPEWRLIAIDNASKDDSAAILIGAADPRISVVRNDTNLGFAVAANQGMRMALAQGAEFINLINNDTQLPADFLGRLLASRAELQADVIVPRIMRLDQSGEAWYAGGHLENDWVFKNVHEPYDPSDQRRVRTVGFASGCCLGLSRRVLLQVGLFDESFFVYWEDADYCLRLKASNIPIFYVNDLVIMHEGAHASGGENNVPFNRLYWRSYIQIVRKHFGFMVAVRTLVRISLKELGRPNKKTQALRAMLLAMARGLTAPLLPPAKT
jgi:GT2 family glycosyltransferase